MRPMELPGRPPYHDSAARDNWLTLASLGALAAVLSDLVHEVLGHLLTGLLRGAHLTRLSSVGLQTLGHGDRLLSASGTVANLLAGVLSLLCMPRPSGAPAGTGVYFLLLFAAFNLFNSGYLVFSGITGQGDWAVVIAGATPAWLWRAGLILAGVALYWLAAAWTGWQLEARFNRDGLTRAQWYTLLLVPYLAATAVLVAASVFNPYDRSLILVSGLGASAVLNYGLLAAGGQLRIHTAPGRPAGVSRPVSLPWLLAALIAAGLFIGVLGPGICLDCGTGGR